MGKKYKYFYIEEINSLKTSSIDSKTIIKFNLRSNKLENLTGAEEDLDKLNFNFEKGEGASVNENYFLEEIEEDKAYEIIEDRKKEWGCFIDYFSNPDDDISPNLGSSF